MTPEQHAAEAAIAADTGGPVLTPDRERRAGDYLDDLAWQLKQALDTNLPTDTDDLAQRHQARLAGAIHATYLLTGQDHATLWERHWGSIATPLNTNSQVAMRRRAHAAFMRELLGDAATPSETTSGPVWQVLRDTAARLWDCASLIEITETELVRKMRDAAADRLGLCAGGDVYDTVLGNTPARLEALYGAWSRDLHTVHTLLDTVRTQDDPAETDAEVEA
jgi:hypothetical protein